MIMASFAEILSIGAVLPFLGVLTAPEQIFDNPALQPLIKALGFRTPEQLLLPVTLMFAGAVLVAGAMRLLLVWANTRLSFAAGADIGISIYRRTLYQPYEVHVGRNSSEVINGITGKANSVINSVILPLLILISSSIMLGAILLALLIIDPIIALVSFGCFGTLYLIVIRLTRAQLLNDSQRIATESTNVVKALQEGLGGIRDVLIDGNQESYCQIYRDADRPLRQAQGNVVFIGSSPRYAMEALGMTLIAVLAYTISLESNGIATAIPVLGALALGAQRLLPVLQQAYGAWSNIIAGHASLRDTLILLDQPLPDLTKQSEVHFQEMIDLNDISFRYSADTPWVLKNLALKIEKGSRIGILGTTGSGKSSLLDILMGLLSPTEGTLAIDGVPVTSDNNRSWQLHIAHVPQAIYLADSTIEENIAFGISKNKIDHERVKQAAKPAQISDFIEKLPNKYCTYVGERGVRISGGQRQRIGIARALYKQADVIILDEATSALDNATELDVMHAIEELNPNLTIIIVAHRLSTLKNCTRVLELKDGVINPVENIHI